MDNPFEYSKPLPARDMVGRKTELEALSDQLANTHNSRLVGPRRYGKTTVIGAALDRARDDGLVAVNVNFLGVLTLEDIADRIDRAYGEQLDSRLKQWFIGVVRTLQPTLRGGGGPLPASVEVSPRQSDRALLDRLALPRRVHERHGKRCAIAFDEFQDVLRAGKGVDGIIRSEIERHHGVAGYVFSGSHVGMMRDLFIDRRRAFFAQATPIDLSPLAADDLAEYVAARFGAQDRRVGEALGPLLDLAQGHPQRALLLANKLFARTPHGDTATTDTWSEALTDACQEVEPELSALWESLSGTAQRVVATIADGAIRLNSRAASERYGVRKGGNNQKAIEWLSDEAHVGPLPSAASGWGVIDPLLDLWLRGGRSWPT